MCWTSASLSHFSLILGEYHLFSSVKCLVCANARYRSAPTLHGPPFASSKQLYMLVLKELLGKYFAGVILGYLSKTLYFFGQFRAITLRYRGPVKNYLSCKTGPKQLLDIVICQRCIAEADGGTRTKKKEENFFDFFGSIFSILLYYPCLKCFAECNVMYTFVAALYKAFFYYGALSY